MLPDTLLKKITELAETYAEAKSCRDLAHVVTTEAERAHLNARADYWNDQLSDQYAQLTATINSIIPPTVYSLASSDCCVRVTRDGQIEVRGEFDNGERHTSIKLSHGQAVNVGTALIACAAASFKQLGGHLTELLTPIPPASFPRP